MEMPVHPNGSGGSWTLTIRNPEYPKIIAETGFRANQGFVIPKSMTFVMRVKELPDQLAKITRWSN